MNINQLGEGVAGSPKPGFELEGAPQFTNWSLLDEGLSTGIWQATPGHHKVIRDQSIIEAFLILEGEIELFEEGQDLPRRFGAGDLVVIHPGFKGSWRTQTTVRKLYCTVVNKNSEN
ncbi:cupin domain-containing protein [Pseudochrobactrum sp. MP213Fo]|uniref:cupin domain-containing protein n=1 Tax=Pseudochrobactrum sp. MP213Fo TaxID=3022250 RepID=UPI003BA354E8